MWVSDVLLVLLFILVLFGPGILLGLAAGLSRWTAVAAGPLLTYGLTAVAEQVCIALGLSFGPVPVLVVTGLSTAAVLGLAQLTRLRSSRRSSSEADDGDREQAVQPASRGRLGELVIVAGVLIGALLGALTALAAMGRLDAINQDWDASFHANATRFILDTGNADPGALSALYPQASLFYPNTWHALGAVVGRLSGASIPALLGAQTILVAGIAGLGLAALIRAFGGRVACAAVVPVMLASFAGFPIDVLWRGPLLPFAFGVALVPAFLLLFSDTMTARRPTFVVATAIAAAGLLGLQPATALTAGVFAIALVVSRAIRRRGQIRSDLIVGASAAVLTVLLGLTFVGGAFLARGVAAEAQINWPAVESPGQAVGDLLLLNHAAAFPQYWLILPMVAGVIGFARLRVLWWFLAGAGVFVLLFVAAASYDRPLTESLTLPWWNDRWRFVAIVTLALAILASHGVVTVADALARLVRRIPKVATRPRRLVLGAAVLATLAVVGLGSSGFYAPYNADRMNAGFAPSGYVSSAERAGMSYLASVVEPGQRVMNDPKDGSVWMYALDGVEPIFGHVVDPGAAIDALDEDARVLLRSFTCLDTDPAVRALIERYDISYVFLGGGFLREGFERAPGLRGLGDSNSLELVYSDGGLRIFKVELSPLLPVSAATPSCSPGRA